MRAGYYRSWI